MSFPLLELPDEMLIRIMSFIPHLDLVTRIGRVCRKLAVFSRDDALWRHVYLHAWGDTRTLDKFRTLAKLSCLQTLGLCRVNTPYMLVREALENSPGLCSLEVSQCSKVSNDFFIMLGEKGLSVKKLSLSGTNMGNVNTSHCKKAFSRLTHLDLSLCQQLSQDDCLVSLADDCPNLSHLNIQITVSQHFNFPEEAFAYFIKKSGKMLRSLFFLGDFLSNRSFKPLAVCRNLSELGVYCARSMDRLGLVAISKLAGLKQLEIVDGGAELSDEDFCVAFQNEHLKNLQSLCLNNCLQLSDQGVKTIAENCPRLTEIRLQCLDKLTHVGVVDLLHHCPRLCHLELTVCKAVEVNRLTWTMLTKLSLLNLTGSGHKNDRIPPKLALELGPDRVVLNYWGDRSGHSELSAYMRYCAEHRRRVRQRYLDQWHLLGTAGLGGPLDPTPKAFVEEADNARQEERRHQVQDSLASLKLS